METRRVINPILAQVVIEKDRMSFLPKYLPGLLSVAGEMLIYRQLEKLSPNYKGGYWEFYALSNNGFYMAPTQPETLEMAVEGNGFYGRISANTAGMIASLFGLSTLAFISRDSTVIDRYDQLRDYVLIHPDHALIMAAID